MRKKNLAALFTFVLILIFSDAKAQNWLGVANSNYAGITGLQLNPSSMAVSRLNQDIYVLGYDIAAQNNYAFYGKVAESTEYKLQDYYRSTKVKNANLNIQFQLPGVMFAGRKHSFALTTAYRVVSSFDDLPWHVAKFGFEDTHFKYSPLQYANDYKHNSNRFKSTPFDIAAMAFFELGASYALRWQEDNKRIIGLGITGKLLLSQAGFFLHSRQFDYFVSPDKDFETAEHATLNIQKIDADYGHAIVDGQNILPGIGFSTDIGLTYLRKPHEGYVSFYKKSKVDNYVYKLGVSVIDLGFVHYNSGAAVNRLKFNNPNNPITWGGIDTTGNEIKFEPDMKQLDRVVSKRIYGQPDAAHAANTFNMVLPTALSVQFDYNVNKSRFFVNSTIIAPITLGSNQVSRPSVIAIIPRYETQFFEISLPYSFYKLQLNRLGFALRFGPITLGTDKFGTFLGLDDFTGLDAYLAIHIPLYKEGNALDPMACFFKNAYKSITNKNKKKRAVKNSTMDFN